MPHSVPHQAVPGKLLLLLMLTSGVGLGRAADEGAHKLPSPKGCPSRPVAAALRPAQPPADFVVSDDGNLHWTVNAVVTPTLTLVRGHAYTFDLTAFGDEHPFIINSNAANPWGTLFAGPYSGEVITFTPTAAMPATLYYHCEVHYGSMVGTIHLVDPPCTGDLNNDHLVNTTDFGIFVNAFGSICTGCAPDLDRNGSVNTTDFGLFVNAFGATCN